MPERFFPAFRHADPPAHRRIWGVIGAVILAVVLATPLLVPVTAPQLRASAGIPAILLFDQHVDHIVFVVMENHAYDNYFGDYCLVSSPLCPDPNNGLSLSTCLPLHPHSTTSACVRPFPFTDANWTVNGSLPHDWISSPLAFDGGRMDDFYEAENSGFTPFGYYTAATAPIYWDLAEQYALDDGFYSSLLDYSLPNHWHIVAGQAPSLTLNAFTEAGAPGVTPASEHAYLNQSNSTRSVEDLLAGSSVSWKYYDVALGTYQQAIQPVWPPTAGAVGEAYDYLNPLAAQPQSYQASGLSHFPVSGQFFSDARNGTLPQIAWVIPPALANDHPPNNSTSAQGFVASVVNAVESSPDWSSTAIFVSWDDYGGFYDGVAPPTVDGSSQLGFRVPLLVIGPYVREDHLFDGFAYFESILHLMELRFGLGCISVLDCGAPLPLDAFNFSQAPRAPMLFPTSVTAGAYPMPLQNLTTALAVPAPYYPPPWISTAAGDPVQGVD